MFRVVFHVFFHACVYIYQHCGHTENRQTDRQTDRLTDRQTNKVIAITLLCKINHGMYVANWGTIPCIFSDTNRNPQL